MLNLMNATAFGSGNFRYVIWPTSFTILGLWKVRKSIEQITFKNHKISRMDDLFGVLAIYDPESLSHD